jgi:uncharacterized RDD family membrane protein YckC
VIDGVVVIVFEALFVVVPVKLIWSLSTWHMLVLFAASWIAALLYVVVCNGSTSGQTLGKRAVGIRLRRYHDLQRAGYGRSMWRQLVSGVADSLFLLSSLSMLWDPERRTWHDHASGTAVVQGVPGPGPASAVVVSAMLVLLTGIGTAAAIRHVDLDEHTSQLFDGSSHATYEPYVPTPTFSVAPSGPDLRTQSFPHGVTFTESGEGGYTYTVSLNLGEPVAFVEGMHVAATGIVGSACDINDETDALIIAEVRVVNATTGFTAKPAVRFVAQGAEMENYYSAGAECQTEAGTVWNDGVASGEHTLAYFALIVHDYYVPDHPSGDPSALAKVGLSATQVEDGDGRSLTLSDPKGVGAAMQFGSVTMTVADVLAGSAPTT